MTWGDVPDRLALLELWSEGLLHRRKSQAPAFDELSKLPWTQRTGRRDELALVAGHRDDLERMLDRVWPPWRVERERMLALGLTLDERGWRRFEDLAVQAGLPDALPEQLNRRTATAAVTTHSKAGLTPSRLEALGPVQVTQDGVIRLRPNPSLELVRAGQRYDAVALTALLGEIAVSERSLRQGTRLAGRLPAAVLSVENRGPYVDLQPPPDWLVVHVPGWDTATVRPLLEQLPAVPVVHFGDLDPNGLRIVRHLRELRPGLRWAIPAFWSELVPSRALRRSWPEALDLTDTPALVRELAASGLWLEQETIALDPRLPAALLDQLR